MRVPLLFQQKMRNSKKITPPNVICLNFLFKKFSPFTYFFCLKLKISKISGLDGVYFLGKHYNCLGLVLTYFPDIIFPPQPLSFPQRLETKKQVN